MDISGWSGVPRPERVVIEGAYARLEPFDIERHGDQLFRSARQEGAEERFRYLFDAVPAGGESFARWMEEASASTDPLFYAVIEKATGCSEGRQAFMRIDPTHGVIEIGNILWGPAIARSRVTTEALFLFASYAFDTLGYRRFEWKCHDGNVPSKRAAERFGFTFEGVFRNHMVVKGENRDTAWYSITFEEWPALRTRYQAWLDPTNFDKAGLQKRRLGDVVA